MLVRLKKTANGVVLSCLRDDGTVAVQLAPGPASATVSEAQIAAALVRFEALAAWWAELPVGEHLELPFPAEI